MVNRQIKEPPLWGAKLLEATNSSSPSKALHVGLDLYGEKTVYVGASRVRRHEQREDTTPR